MRRLAKRMATELHNPESAKARSPNGKYGFHVPTHCGETEQDNTFEDDWMVFFRDRRIGDLIDRIGDQEITRVGKDLRERSVSAARARVAVN
jgi:protein-ribulosamine 3-kinase